MQGYEIHGGLPAERVDATWRLPMHKIVIANWLADLSKDRFGDADYSLVPNSVDAGQFFAPPRGMQSVPTMGMMYSHVPFKGCDIGIKAFELASQKVAGLKMVSFGSRGPTPEPARCRRGPNSCSQPAQKAAIRRSLRPGGCVAVCQPKRGLRPADPGGDGLPHAGDRHACRMCALDLLAYGGGMLIPHEDPAAMAAAIVQICQMDNPAWRILSDKAYHTATRYTWDDATTLFEAALERRA